MNANHRSFEKGLVSVVIPTFNSAGTVEKAVHSVLRQDYRPVEIVVSDDCSTDGTVRIVAKLASDTSVPIKILCAAENAGPAVSRNLALEAAQGQYVAFLDSDDQWRSAKLSTQIGYMRDTGAAITHTAYRRVRYDHEDEGRAEKLVAAQRVVTYQDLLRSNLIGMSTAMVDRQQLGDVYLPLLRMRQDYALWMTLARAGWVSHGITEALTDYAVRQASLSSNPVTSLSYTWRVFKDYSGLSTIPALWFFGVNALNALRKRL